MPTDPPKPEGTALSQAALEQHGRAIEESSPRKFAEAVIREEGVRMFQQTMNQHGQQRHIVTLEDAVPSMAQIPGPSTFEDLAQIQRLYGTSSCGATPMERFLTLSPSHDPFPLHSKKAMSDAGLTYGSLETMDARVAAVHAIVASGRSLRLPQYAAEERERQTNSAPPALASRLQEPKEAMHSRRSPPSSASSIPAKRQRTA